MILDKLYEQKLIHPPKFLLNGGTQYLVYTGSTAYGVAEDASDLDCYGFGIPPKEMVFSETYGGEIQGFGSQKKKFNVWTEHHVKTQDGNKEYDFSVYNIVSYFDLCMKCSPNMLDSLFAPRRCILHETTLAQHVRDNRKLFLSKKAMHTFRGYMFAQMSKIKNKTNSSNPKRAAMIEEHTYDVKFAYHCIRLCLECEQILAECDLDIERNSEILKSVRRGEWTLDQIEEWCSIKEKGLEQLYASSNALPFKPDEEAIKNVLMECLEMHFGSISTMIARNPSMENLLQDLNELVEKYKGKLDGR